MSSSLGVPVHNCHRAQALPRRGPLAVWVARWPAVARRRDGALGQASASGPEKWESISSFPVNKRSLFILVMDPTSIHRSKLRGCPKIVKLSLLGSQKCHLPVSTVSSPLAVRMVGSYDLSRKLSIM